MRSGARGQNRSRPRPERPGSMSGVAGKLSGSSRTRFWLGLELWFKFTRGLEFESPNAPLNPNYNHNPNPNRVRVRFTSLRDRDVQLDAAVFRPSLDRIVGSDRALLAHPDRDRLLLAESARNEHLAHRLRAVLR